MKAIRTLNTSLFVAILPMTVSVLSGCMADLNDLELGQTAQAVLVKPGRRVCVTTGNNGTADTLELHLWDAPPADGDTNDYGDTYGCTIDGIGQYSTECCTMRYIGNDTSESEAARTQADWVTERDLFMIHNNSHDEANITTVSIQDEAGGSTWTDFETWDCGEWSTVCTGHIGDGWYHTFKLGKDAVDNFSFPIYSGTTDGRAYWCDADSAVDILDNDEVIYDSEFHGYGEEDKYPYALAWASGANISYLTQSTSNPLNSTERSSSAVIGGTVVMPSTLDSGAVTLFEIGGVTSGINLVLRDGETLELYGSGQGYSSDLLGKGKVSVTPGGTYSFIIEIDTTDNNIALYWANVANRTLINARTNVITVATLTSDTWTGTDAIGLGEIHDNVAGSVGGDFTGTFSGFVHIFKNLDL